MKMRSRIVIALSLVSLFVVPLGAIAKEKGDDPVKVFEEQMKKASDDERVKLINGLVKKFAKVKKKDPAGKAISKYTSKGSSAVRVAAIKALGDLKYKKALGKLKSMIKPLKKEPVVLAAVVETIGVFGDARFMEDLVDVAKKWLPKDSKVASAAARGLGKIPSRACVDELIKLLDLTYPKQSTADGAGAIGDDVRQMLAKSRPAIVAGLQELTGWDFTHAFAWNNFWDKRSKTWKPGAKEVDLTKLKVWEDPGYGFAVKKPGKKWMFERDPKGRNRIKLVRMEENTIMGMFYLEVYESGNTPAGEARRIFDYYEGDWKDIKKESLVQKPVPCAGQKGFLQQFTGRSRSGTILKQKEIYLKQDAFIYAVRGYTVSGASDETRKELDKIFDSFRFTL
jgi:HEAT repeat protein